MGRYLCSILCVCGMTSIAVGAEAAPTLDSAHTESEQHAPGVAFTPELARALAGSYVRGVLAGRYDLPEDRIAAAQELVARKLMEFAHATDGPAQELLERSIAAYFENLARGRKNELVPSGYAREFATRVEPLLPEVRRTVRGIGKELRPLLPLKGQLTLAGDLLAVSAAVDGFEETMDRWSQGQVAPNGDPFRPASQPARDESGASERLANARRWARGTADSRWSFGWKTYVEQFKAFYQLDQAQGATADSVLREFAEREERLGQNGDVAERLYQVDLWMQMAQELPDGVSPPILWLISDDLADAYAERNILDRGLKQRLESIPTESQRKQAVERVRRALREAGLNETEGQR